MFSFHHLLHRGSKLCQEKCRRAGDRCVTSDQQDSLEDVCQNPKLSVLKGWPALIRTRKGNNFLIFLTKMAKNVYCFLDDQDTDQCVSTSEKDNKTKVSLEAEKLLPVTLPKDISRGKHCLYVGTVYSGTTPEIQNRSPHVSLYTRFSII